MEYDFVNGALLLVDKPLHWTSFDVVAKLRKLCKVKKIGHAGTLDPLATGLLIVCTGRKTKSIQEYQELKKTYQAVITLGATTPTHDAEFPPQNPQPYQHITQSQVEEVIQHYFTGDIVQTPPIYSAVKVRGKAAYELARKGKTVELQPRPIHIYRFEVLNFDLPHLSVEIECSKGTYIRRLAHDLGQQLGTGGYLTYLRRTKIGDFDVSQAKTIQEWIDILTSSNL
ncbi:MAG: tRNA pseudouridine(55) synthase TruB [Bacteroidia bacterium]|nr:tRNA pseudouridine(55) synthase TruB [Bacteroidia bacterium]MDW8347964.1 tRNA pseudouridine(55) synthase TruB [Bacteroidia bacterium]